MLKSTNLTKLDQWTEVQIAAVLILCECAKTLRSFNKQLTSGWTIIFH